MKASLSLVAVLVFLIVHAEAQGPLAPPGAPAPVFKTLHEVEPRTPISFLPTNLTAAGSYYLTTNLTCASCTGGQNGVLISADDVTLDLNGFTIAGVAGSGSGIIGAGAGRTNMWIRNGTVRGWGSTGIFVGNAGRVTACTAIDNTGIGIATGSGCLVRDCVTAKNIQGIALGSNSVAIACVASGNTGNGFNSYGDNCIVSDCAVSGNASAGIVTANRWAVTGCVVNRNIGDGIRLGVECLATGNVCSGNTNNARTAAGIFVFFTYTGNRIEGNQVNGNNRGIVVDGSPNLIIKNTARGNLTNYVISAGNVYGPTNVVSGELSPANSNPFSNFAY